MKDTDKTPNTARARVEIELEELNEKMRKLGNFLESDKTQSLSRVSYELLCVQLQTMKTYASILEKRLFYWDEKQSENR